ncbi:MAG: hypothetical protein ACLP5H_30805 [Desulfomonilaceae bacterium]
MDYLAWNDAIGARFFNPDRSGARVFLYVTTDLVMDIGAPHDADLNDFIAAVKTGPPWNTRHGRSICQQALQALEGWRNRNLTYPPYLIYLALFVLADTIDVGFARHAYYPGLRYLLGEEPETGMYPSFDCMYLLWDDLAVWSNRDRHGDWGVFDADIVGEWMHVGLPRAQTLLTDEERDSLPFLFADNGLDPLSLPSDREIAYLLASDAHHYLRPRTKELLGSTSERDSPNRAALIEAFLDELERWDGTVPPHPDSGEQSARSLGNLRLAMLLDRTAQTVRFFLRCRSNRAYPDEGLQLIGEEIKEPLYCYEDWQGWSTPLSNSETQASNFDASHLDWRDGLSLIDNDHAWKTTLSKRSIRVMINGTPFGFDGFVEDSQIPQGKSFCLLAHNDQADKLQTWGNECCEGFAALDLIAGLPAGWCLYSVDRANSDDHIRDDFPSLAFPAVLRIQLRGGLKTGGHQYFTFALPDIEVTSAVEGVDVFCNDHQLTITPETGMYRIPDCLCARRLIVEVRRDGACIRRKSLYAVETVEWRNAVSRAHLDKFGQRTDSGAAETCVGSIVVGVTPPEFNPVIFLPPSAGHRVYFVGKNPGEIVECPNENIPGDWQPVWAVLMQGRGKGIAIYCGTDPANEAPVTAGCENQKRRKLWKDILWYRRKRIACPSHPTLRSLWQRYKEVAHHVR